MEIKQGIESREKSYCASDGIYSRQAKEYTKLLQTYDPDLIARWLPDQSRWSIWTKDKKGHAYLCYVCVDKATKGFRHIGQADINFIGAMDQYRKDKAYSLLKEVEEKNALITREHKKKLKDAVTSAARDRWRQFTGAKMIPVGIQF